MEEPVCLKYIETEELNRYRALTQRQETRTRRWTFERGLSFDPVSRIPEMEKTKEYIY